MTRHEINQMQARDDVTQDRLFRLIIICQYLGLTAIAGLVVAGLLWR